ncbi:MAG TPA: APC family permease [Solirubrobacterales bacterium]
MGAGATAFSEADRPTPLRRAITPGLLLLFILGDVLGGGIYALVGEVAGETGGAIWAAFVVALGMALFTAGSYAELVTKYPRAGGAGLYTQRAFGRPSVSFMVTFAVVASGIASAATLARAFGGDYLSAFVDLPLEVAAAGLLLAVAALNFRGISESVRVNVVFTLVEVAGLILIVAIAAVALAQGNADAHRAFEFRQGSSVVAATLAGAAIAFYALIGFEDSVNVAEEAERPRQVYPRVLYGGLLIAGCLYLLVTVGASMVVPTQDLVGSAGPLLEVVRQGPLGIPPKLFSAIGLLALANGALINMIMASRLLYGMAGEDVVPPIFGRVHPQRQTPLVAIVFTTGLAVMLALTGDLAVLADTTVTLLLMVFGVVNVSVLVLRRDRVPHEHFSVPWPVPVIGLATTVGLLTQIDAGTWVRAGLLLALGAGVWGLNEVLRRRTVPRA